MQQQPQQQQPDRGMRGAYESQQDKSGGRPDGVAEGIKLFKAPNNGEFYFYIMPHADAVATQDWYTGTYALKMEMYARLLGRNTLYVAPSVVGHPDAMDRALDEDYGIKWEKNDNLNPYQKELRVRMRTSTKVLMYICTPDEPDPMLWVMGQQTFEDKIWPGICTPWLEQQGIHCCNPHSGMWFKGVTTGSGKQKRIGAAQPCYTSPCPLDADSNLIAAKLAKLVRLEDTCRLLTSAETEEYKSKIVASMEGFQDTSSSAAPMQHPGQPGVPQYVDAPQQPPQAGPAVQQQPPMQQPVQQPMQQPQGMPNSGGPTQPPGAQLPPGVQPTQQPMAQQPVQQQPPMQQPAAPVSPMPPQDGQTGANVPPQQPMAQQPVQQPPVQQQQNQQPAQQPPSANSMAPSGAPSTSAAPNFGQPVTPAQLASAPSGGGR